MTRHKIKTSPISPKYYYKNDKAFNSIIKILE